MTYNISMLAFPETIAYYIHSDGSCPQSMLFHKSDNLKVEKSLDVVEIKEMGHEFIWEVHTEGIGLRKIKTEVMVCRFCYVHYKTFINSSEFCPKAD